MTAHATTARCAGLALTPGFAAINVRAKSFRNLRAQLVTVTHVLKQVQDAKAAHAQHGESSHAANLDDGEFAPLVNLSRDALVQRSTS